MSLSGFGAVGRRLFEDLRCGSGSTLDSARIKCDLGSSSGSLLHSPVSQWWAKVSEKGRKVFYTHGGTVCAGLREDSLLRFAKFLGEEVGGWVSLEEGLPQHAFKGGLMALTRVKCG